MNLSDIEIEVLLFGKWRFNTDWEKISLEFKDDMTYEQSRIQTFILSKPGELLTGNKFNGVWYVNDGKLCLVLKTLPKSFLNLQLPILSKLYFADMVVSICSLFITEKYEITEINNSKFIIKDEQQLIVATKIK